MGDVDEWGKGIRKWGEGGEGVWWDGEAVVIIIRLCQHKLSLLQLKVEEGVKVKRFGSETEREG